MAARGAGAGAVAEAGVVGRVRVRLVSLLRDAVGGARSVEVEVPGEGMKLGELLEKLFRMYPRLREVIRGLEERGLNVVYMVNGESAGSEHVVRPGDELVVLPPASGG